LANCHYLRTIKSTLANKNEYISPHNFKLTIASIINILSPGSERVFQVLLKTLVSAARHMIVIAIQATRLIDGP
jgi:hypothetical protein